MFAKTSRGTDEGKGEAENNGASTDNSLTCVGDFNSTENSNDYVGDEQESNSMIGVRGLPLGKF